MAVCPADCPPGCPFRGRKESNAAHLHLGDIYKDTTCCRYHRHRFLRQVGTERAPGSDRRMLAVAQVAAEETYTHAPWEHNS
jgi:hypothetical protein